MFPKLGTIPQALGIRPIEVAPITPSASFFPMDALHSELYKTTRKPFFSGQEEDWANFWDDWEDYWGRVAGGKVVEETQKVQIFESCLDDVNRRAFVQERKVKGDLTFMQMKARLESRYGRHRQSRLRRAFELLACKDDCDLRDWDSFKTDFKALACELQDTLTP